MTKFVFAFHEGSAEMKNILGGKGANLAEMKKVGLPVPPGFTISTEACHQYFNNNKALPEVIIAQLQDAITELETVTGKKFGDKTNPLLVSVRSGSVFSMPGMMDTILNLGLNDETVLALERLTGNGRFAHDCYRRFIQMFGNVVLGVDHYHFEEILDQYKEANNIIDDPSFTSQDWKQIIDQYKLLVSKKTKQSFPQDPYDQLIKSINAVFDSWNNQRAVIYRKINRIPDNLGTAVNIQMMVFGNMGEDSGTGVAFTRNPSTGENILYGEYLVNAQGEDVVAGIRTPKEINTLAKIMPEAFNEFQHISKKLEAHFHEMQDIEFTIEKGKLYLLQTRTGKRTARAAVKIAYDFVKEGVIDKETALLRIDPDQLNQLLHRRIDDGAEIKVIAKGLPASPGAATGKVVFDADTADDLASQGEKVILVRPETTPEDIHGIVAAQGVITSRGGMTSHAAVVARGMGKACICGCEELQIDLRANLFKVGAVTVYEGDMISMDGASGRIILGQIPLIDPELSPEFKEMLRWTDSVRHIGVRANADNPIDAAKAKEFGAEGIGLCRTEHMFMEAERVPLVQRMILSETQEERVEALQKLLPLQRSDFKGILREMKGLPVTIRLLDPPLHEFLPNLEHLLVEVTKLRQEGDKAVLAEKEVLLRKVRSLHEMNPMLGHRGCRLGIVYPEIYVMQVTAIFEAVASLHREGIDSRPEIMIPLVGHVNELKLMREIVEQEAKTVMEREGFDIQYTIGTMIEVPRAALTADEIATAADFFSFGTNDLTQTTFGYSRDDAEGKFLQHYLDHKILTDNPFSVLDENGVGKLVTMALESGKRIKPDIKTGICGEHGGEKRSIEFCYRAGLDYVSCSPYRVPIARWAGAQATIKWRK